MNCKRAVDETLIKVANIIEEGKLGGPQVRMVRVARAMEDVRTLIVMPVSNSEMFQQLCAENGLDWRTMRLTRITREWRVALMYVFFSWVEVVRLTRLLRQEKIEVVHASGGSWQYKAVIAAWFAGVPSIWHLNDTEMPGWVRRIFSLIQPLASGFIFASNRSREYYGTALCGRIQDVIPSTVDSAHFDPSLICQGDESLISRLEERKVIGTVANVNPIKGIETLIRAAALLRDEVPDLSVVVIGAIHANQKRYHAWLVQLARELGVTERIEWVGSRQDIRPLMSRFDVYVCSSKAESSPVSVWEAMSMAKPVVSTDVGDVSRHISDGENGYIVNVGDHESMSTRIRYLIRNREMCGRFGKKSRCEVQRSFDPVRIAEKTSALYRRVLAEESRHINRQN